MRSIDGEGSGDGLLTPAEVAALFRVDPKTVTRWATAGKLTSLRTLGGHRRYRAAEVHALLLGASTATPAPTLASAAASGQLVDAAGTDPEAMLSGPPLPLDGRSAGTPGPAGAGSTASLSGVQGAAGGSQPAPLAASEATSGLVEAAGSTDGA